MAGVQGFSDKYDKAYKDIYNHLCKCKVEEVNTDNLKVELPNILEPFQTIVLDFVNVKDEEKGKRVTISIDKGERIFTYMCYRDVTEQDRTNMMKGIW